MKKLILLFTLILLIILSGYSNNVSVNNIELKNQNAVDHYCTVEFDLSWDNAWNTTTSVPFNHDAVWVFVKFSAGGGPWQHATLHGTGHTAPGGFSISVPADSTGVFIIPPDPYTGNPNLSDVQLRWDYSADWVGDDAQLELKVGAIEMVYVNEGSFWAGDQGSTDAFFTYGAPFAYLVDAYSITIGTALSDLYAVGNLNWTGTLDSQYPTGYDAFYCMKYEISQEQYVDFLNSLSRDQQNTRTVVNVSGTTVSNYFVMSNTTTVFHRNAIRCPGSGLGTTDPITFFCDYSNNGTSEEDGDGQNIACNKISWMDLAAYADWAGLRPMTELEYEKACRGPNPYVMYEYAWGNTKVNTENYLMTMAGYMIEGISNMKQDTGHMINNTTWTNFGGPARCGIFAASATNHTRVETGATYYGIMEMSGNVLEMLVTVGNAAGVSYTGLHGDGTLTSEGDANTDHWPGINGNANYNAPNGQYATEGVTAAGGAGERGNLSLIGDTERVSDRSNAANNTHVTANEYRNGGRLVRTAP